MKLCKDCKHISNTDIYYPRCNRPGGYEFVHGELQLMDSYCCNERSTGWLQTRLQGVCGKEGRYFERKE